MSIPNIEPEAIRLKPGDSVSRILLALKDRRTGLAVDLSSSQTRKLRFEGAATGSRDMTVEGSPLDGVLAYQVQTDDFKTEGVCSSQAEVTFPGGKPLTSDTVPILIQHKIRG